MGPPLKFGVFIPVHESEHQFKGFYLTLVGFTFLIFITDKKNEADLVTAFYEGGNNFIGKPVSRGELPARIQTHLMPLEFQVGVIDHIRLLLERMTFVKIPDNMDICGLR